VARPLISRTASSRPTMARLVRAAVAIWAGVVPGTATSAAQTAAAWPSAGGWANRGGVRGWGRVRGAVRRVGLCGVPCPGLSGLFPGVFCGLDDHHSRERRRQGDGVFISVTRRAEPGYLAEWNPEQEELRLISRVELASYGSSLRFRSGRAPGTRIPCAHFAATRLPSSVRGRLLGPCAGGPASPVRTSQRGARLASATPRATGPRCSRPRPVSVLTWACVPVLGAADSSPGITPTRMSELTATLLPAASHTRLSSPRPPPILFTGRDLYQSGSPLEGPDRPLPGLSGCGGHSCLSRYPGGSTD
jgi:hypothetical protein